MYIRKGSSNSSDSIYKSHHLQDEVHNGSNRIAKVTDTHVTPDPRTIDVRVQDTRIPDPRVNPISYSSGKNVQMPFTIDPTQPII